MFKASITTNKVIVKGKYDMIIFAFMYLFKKTHQKLYFTLLEVNNDSFFEFQTWFSIQTTLASLGSVNLSKTPTHYKYDF